MEIDQKPIKCGMSCNNGFTLAPPWNEETSRIFPAEWHPVTWHGYPDACHMPGLGIFPVDMAWGCSLGHSKCHSTWKCHFLSILLSSPYLEKMREALLFSPCVLSTFPALISHQGCWFIPFFSINFSSPCFALLLAKTQTLYFHSGAWIASLTFWVEEGSLLKRIREHFVQRAGLIIQHYPGAH